MINKSEKNLRIMFRLMLVTATIFLVFAFSASSSASVYFRKSRASCPTVTTKPDFDYRPVNY